MEIIRLFKIILFRYYITKGFKLNTLDVLNYSNKINNLDDVIIYMDSILDLLKDDVEKIAKSKNIWFFDFDYLFIESGKILKNQLKKKHLSGIKKFYYSENIDIAISWMISRLINNMRNIN